MTALMQRQNAIIEEVQNHMKRQKARASRSQRSNQHPALAGIRAEHERIVERNVRYIDTLHRSHLKYEEQQLRRNSSSSQRGSLSRKGSQSSNSNRSRLSRQSVDSRRSSVSQHSQRLSQVRLQQEETQRSRKQLYQEKIARDSQKSLRASQQSEHRSRRTKTRGEVQKQIVDENRKELEVLKNAEIRDHLQRLKFKIGRTEQIRANHMAKKQKSSGISEQAREIRRRMEEEERRGLERRQVVKDRTAQQRIENQELLRREAALYQQRSLHVRQSQAQQVLLDG